MVSLENFSGKIAIQIFVTTLFIVIFAKQQSKISKYSDVEFILSAHKAVKNLGGCRILINTKLSIQYLRLLLADDTFMKFVFFFFLEFGSFELFT